MYMDDIKLLAKNEKELEIQLLVVRIYSQDKRIEFGKDICAMLTVKSGKQQMTEDQKYKIKLKSECSKKRKLKNTWEY